MKRYILLLLAGLVLMIAGCVPFGKAINNSFSVNEILNKKVVQNKNYIFSILKINTRHYIMPSIKLKVSSTEIHSNRSSEYNEYEAKFRFPITLVISDSRNKVLYQLNRDLDWDSGSRSYLQNEVNARSGIVIVEFDLEKISIDESTEISISILIGDDRYYYASLQSASLIVYDNVRTHTSNILTGIAIIVFGIIIFIIGLIMLIIKQTNTTRNNSLQETSIMEQDTNNLSQNKNKFNDSSITTSAMLCHLSSFAGLFFPFGGVLGPLIMWQIKKDDDPFINRHGIVALNFRLSMAIYYFISILLAFVFIGFLFLMILAVTDLILTIIACIKASNSEEYRYPITITFIRYPDVANTK